MLDPGLRRTIPDDTKLLVSDDADFLDVIARLDETYLHGKKARRGKVEIPSILQLIWNAKDGAVYEDIGIEGRGPDNEWLPIRENPAGLVPDGSNILVTPDPGC